MAWGLADRVPVTAQSGVHLVGLPAPGFIVTLFEGGEYSLADRASQPAVINFWGRGAGHVGMKHYLLNGRGEPIKIEELVLSA